MCTWRWLASPAARRLRACRRARAQRLPRGRRAPAARSPSAARSRATVGSHDDSAFFNYTDYEHNALRMFRLSLAGMWRPDGAPGLPDRGPLRRRRSSVDPLRALRAGAALEGPRRSTSRRGGSRRSSARSRAARYGADNPLIGYPARLPVPDVAPARRRAGDRRRPAADARARLARELSGRRTRRRRRACRWSAPTGGTPGVQAHAAAGPLRGGRSRSPPARSRIRASTTTTADGSVSARVAWKPIVGLVLGALRRRAATS